MATMRSSLLNRRDGGAKAAPLATNKKQVNRNVNGFMGMGQYLIIEMGYGSICKGVLRYDGDWGRWQKQARAVRWNVGKVKNWGNVWPSHRSLASGSAISTINLASSDRMSELTRVGSLKIIYTKSYLTESLYT
jgi:hypothetical protein